MDKTFYGLTNPQKSIFLTEQFFQGTSVNNICGTVIIHEKVDFTKLTRAIRLGLKTNSSLRIRLKFDNKLNTAKQYFADFVMPKTDIITLDTKNALRILERKIASEPFKLYDKDLFKLQLFRFKGSKGEGGFIMNMHHIIADAATCDMLANKIMSVYEALVTGKEIPDISSNYEDFIMAENAYLESPKFTKDKEYWDEVYTDIPDSVSLSLKNESSLALDSKRHQYVIDKKSTKAINKFCRNNQISPFNFWMALYSLYISKVRNTESFVIGTPILNRLNFNEKHTTGMFISTVPLKLSLEGFTDFITYAKSISQNSMGMLRHQRYPYQSLLEDLRETFENVPNLYNMMISYQDTKATVKDGTVNYDTRWTKSDYALDELDIHLFDMNETGSLNIAYDFQTAKYTPDDVDDLHKNIMYIARQIVREDITEFSKIQLVIPEDKEYLVKEYNATPHYEITETTTDMFLRQVTANPDKLAIVDGKSKLTYKQFYNIASNMEIEGKRVCLFLPNSINLMAAIFGAHLKSICYIPIDVNYPIDRVEYIFENSGTQVILTDSENYKKLGKLQKYAKIVDWKSIKNTDGKIKLPKLSTPAYIIYTSGSTGKPKGVEILHESLSNYIGFCEKQYVNNEETNFPLYSSCSFDLTVTSIFTPLCTGNTCYIYRDSNPQIMLKRMLEENNVHIIKLTPAHLSLLFDLNVGKRVNKLIVGGDILTTDSCKNITELFKGNVHIYNEYGPTETTVGCMIYEYKASDNERYTSVPIGIPIDNTELYVLNKDLNVVPFEQEGDLYIAGLGLSPGYIGLPKMNKERFIDCPFNPGHKMYKTGDVVVMHRDGQMEYFTRSDFQVKINGFRIEIGEIQKQILAFNGIKDCFVHVIEQNGTKALGAYYVVSKKIDEKELKKHLSSNLPNYMIPKYFYELEEIPLTGNGKVDKKKLPIPEVEEVEYIPPKGDVEKALAEVLCNLLDLEKISVATNIFDYYVDSLVIIKAQTILSGKGLDIKTQDFYDFPTIRSLANEVCKNNSTVENKDEPTAHESYPTDISKLQVKRGVESKEFSNVLLFGATGFLGMHILYSLLKNTNATINCVVRAKYKVSAIKRLLGKFEYYFKDDNVKNYRKRIKVVEGNINDDHFGFSDKKYNHLGEEIDLVVTTAAIVKHYGNYSTFYETNVKGTERLIEFCEKFNIPLHYSSTMSVSGYGLVKTPEAVFTENNFYIGQDFKDNVYVRSKFEAENLIFKACSKGLLNASIYRLGNLTNRFSDAMFQENYKENAFANRLESIAKLGKYPRDYQKFGMEFSPVDEVADIMVNLFSETPYNINVYHVYNENLVEISRILKLMKKKGINVDLVSIKDFEEAIAKDPEEYFGIVNYMKLLRDKDYNNLKLSNLNTNIVYEDLAIAWSHITDEYLEMIIDSIV